MIASERPTSARPATVHELLVDVDAWKLWSPHVASVDGPAGRIHDGWAGSTRAFFAPRPTPMIVDELRPDGGYRWHAEVWPWRLSYDNRVEASGTGSVVRFTARLDGPSSGLLERLVGPLSALGQRRRMRRLADLAELVERIS